MGETRVSPGVGTCDAGDVLPKSRAGDNGVETIPCSFDPVHTESSLETSTVDLGSVESSPAVQLLDEELAELDQLIGLQRRQVDALRRLRHQWLSGERRLPDVPTGLSRGSFTNGAGGVEIAAASADTSQDASDWGRGYRWEVSPPRSQLPTGVSEQYMTPHARIPLASPVIATEVLSFRLKGGINRPSSRSGGSGGSGSGGSSSPFARNQNSAGGARSGFLNVFAFLHADGVVRLHDADGEEIVAFDARHVPRSSSNEGDGGEPLSFPTLDGAPASSSSASSSSASPATEAWPLEGPTPSSATDAPETVSKPAVVVGLTAESSDADPVLVTAVADGTMRVHALTVYYRGKKVGGLGLGRDRSRSGGNHAKGKRAAPGTRPASGVNEGGGGDGGSAPPEPREASPRTMDRGTGGGGVDGSSSISSTNDKNDGKETRQPSTHITDGISNNGDSRRGGGGGRRSQEIEPPPATAIGVGISVEFRTCLGSACSSYAGRPHLRNEPAGKEAAADTTRVSGNAGGAAYTAGETSLPPDGKFPTVTSMDAFFHRSLATPVVVAGYSSGGVRFFHAGNGTELGSADTDSGAVLAVKRGGQSVAFSDGGEVHFASAVKFSRTPGRVCRPGRSVGSEGGDGAKVTAVAFDAVSTGILYVGFGTGEVMAYDSRLQEADGSYTCLPSHRFPPPPLHRRAQSSSVDAATAAALPVDVPRLSSVQQSSGRGVGDGGDPGESCSSISTVRGYAVVSQGSSLSVYNTTGGDTRLLFTRHAMDMVDTAAAAPVATAVRNDDSRLCEGWEESGADGLAPGTAAATSGKRWSVMSPASGEVLMAEVSHCSVGEIMIYRAILPYERHSPDISWMRGPVLLLGLLVVAVTQVYSRRAAKTAVGRVGRVKRRGGRRWTADDFSNDDDDVATGGGGGDLSIDNLAHLRGRMSDRASGRRNWKDVQGSSSGYRRDSSSSILPPAGQGYDDRWGQGDSD